jgi:hypothetical protein
MDHMLTLILLWIVRISISLAVIVIAIRMAVPYAGRQRLWHFLHLNRFHLTRLSR